MVAVAALLGDQLGEAPVMIGGAGGVLMHGAELGGGDVLQTVSAWTGCGCTTCGTRRPPWRPLLARPPRS
jgi:hypothetical protein